MKAFITVKKTFEPISIHGLIKYNAKTIIYLLGIPILRICQSYV